MPNFNEQLLVFVVLTLFSASHLSAQKNRDTMPKDALPAGFVHLKEVAPGIIQDVRYFGNRNFVGKPVDGYEADEIIMTVPAAHKLKDVQEQLKQYGLGLKVFDAYRPQRAVDHFMRWVKQPDQEASKERYYPNVSKENLFEEGYIAAKSGHSRGSTVDLTIVAVDSSGNELHEMDMGTGFDHFGPLSWVTNQEITAQQRANRMLLQNVMNANGFNSYSREWWHFTLANEPFPETYFDFPVR